MLIWSGTESLVTIMCSSIPVLRPLYVRIRYGSQGSSGANNSSYKLPMYGAGRNYGANSKYGQVSSAGVEPKMSSSHQATVITYNANNASDESILRAAKAHDASMGIQRTEEVSVTYEQFNKKV